MTSDQLREIIADTGCDRTELARLLGYASENSLRQVEAGKQTLPEPKLAWLIAYARMRSQNAKAEADWLKKNPPPGAKIS